MKAMYIIFILSLFACKSGKETVIAQQESPLLHYSKGSCLGRCPVYDFWIYPNGDFIYKRANGIKSNRKIQGRLTTEEMGKLKTALQNGLGEPISFKKVRDFPVTRLRFEGKKYEYHATKIKDGLKKLNALIEDIIHDAQMKKAPKV